MKLSISYLFLMKGQKDSHLLQYRLHTAEQLVFINKVLRFLEDTCFQFLRTWHPLLTFTKQNRYQKCKIPSKTMAMCVKIALKN